MEFTIVSCRARPAAPELAVDGDRGFESHPLQRGVSCEPHGRSGDARASRIVASDSSLSANASKVRSTRALLPMAPRRHSAASILSNSGEYILSTWPLLRPGQKLMQAPIYRCRLNCASIYSFQ